jgi:hypothetical protein
LSEERRELPTESGQTAPLLPLPFSDGWQLGDGVGDPTEERTRVLLLDALRLDAELMERVDEALQQPAARLRRR